MLERFLPISAMAMLLIGCAGPAIQPAVTLDHPANPNAAEAPLTAPSNTLAVDGDTASPIDNSTGATHPDMKGMDMSGHSMPDMGHPHQQRGGE